MKSLTLIITGWVAGAESGSWLCVHPVIATLPPAQQNVFQKGLLKTFGSVMPVLMPLSLILVIGLYISNRDKTSLEGILQLIASIILATAITTTVLFNVPVNVATRHWEEADYSEDWKRKRKMWRFFQEYRSVVFILVFILLLVADKTGQESG